MASLFREDFVVIQTADKLHELLHVPIVGAAVTYERTWHAGNVLASFAAFLQNSGSPQSDQICLRSHVSAFLSASVLCLEP